MEGRPRFGVPRGLSDVAGVVWGMVAFVLIVVVGVTLVASMSNRPTKELAYDPVAAEEVSLPDKERVIVNLAALHGKTKSGCQSILGIAPRLRMAGSDLWEVDETAVIARYNEADRCYSVSVEIPADAEICPIEKMVARLGFDIGRITEPNQQIVRARCTGSTGEQWSCEATRGDQLQGFSLLSFHADGVPGREAR